MRIHLITFSFISLFFLNSCFLVLDFDKKPNNKCGNGQVDDGEECDGDNLGGEICTAFGFLGGDLHCTTNCQFDKSDCDVGENCGNGVKNAGEECDGGDLNNATCISRGYKGGTLACTTGCTFDVSDCSNADNCGNGQIDNGEECDGINLNGETCQNWGYHGGELACSTNCTFDRADCETFGKCGDNVIQPDSEECDGGELNGETCEGLGYYGGELACKGDCNFDKTACAENGMCGDNVIQPGYEECDGINLNNQTCSDFGYYGGTLSCNTDCSINISDCVANVMCGDNVIQPGESCDGNNLGNGTCNGGDPYDIGCGDNCNYIGCLGPQSISLGEMHTCGISNYNHGYCWGNNSSGQLGNGTSTSSNNPAAVSGSLWFLAIASGGNHTCGIDTTNSTVYCWGSDSNGQLGLGNMGGYVASPATTNTTYAYNSITAGYSHTCGIIVNGGGVYCWGNNNSGQLGIGNTNSKDVPTEVTNFYATDISAGTYFTCAIDTSGTPYCWGSNSNGQLGNNDTGTDNSIPVAVVDEFGVSPSSFSAITTGNDHACGIGNNKVYCWGLNSSGQLGTGNNNDTSYATETGDGSISFYEIAAGANHTCALETTGTAYCWGNNTFGQLGDNTTSSKNLPTQVVSGETFDHIYAGGDTTCAINNLGQIFCWGNNASGQFGDGTTVSSLVPVLSSNSTDSDWSHM